MSTDIDKANKSLLIKSRTCYILLVEQYSQSRKDVMKNISFQNIKFCILGEGKGSSLRQSSLSGIRRAICKK